MDTTTRKPCRYVNIVINSSLDPVNKGLVLEETKSMPLGFIRMLIKKLELKKEYFDALLECHKEYKFKN